MKTLNVIHVVIKLCVWSCPRCDSEWFQKTEKQVQCLSLWPGLMRCPPYLHFSLGWCWWWGVWPWPASLHWPCAPGPREEGRASYSLLAPSPNPNHKLPHVWCPPLTLLTSEADPRPAGCSLKPHTVTTQPPPVAATLLPLTYHPKHYHKLLPGCQAAHTAELTVRLSASLCKDSSVWGEKVELVERGKRSRLRWHFTRDIKPTVVFYVLWLVVIACGTDSAARCTTTVQYLRLMKNVPASVQTVLKHATSLCAAHPFLVWQIMPFHFASASAKIEESIEAWLRRPHTHGVTVITGWVCLFA